MNNNNKKEEEEEGGERKLQESLESGGFVNGSTLDVA